MENEIEKTTTEVIVGKSPVEVMQSAIQSGIDLAKIEKMIELQERWDAMQAKKSFVLAMAKFKNNPPDIIKDKINNKYGSKYVTLGNLISSCLPKMSECELSHKWTTKQDGNIITVTCTVTHSGGHSESDTMSGPPDTSGSKNPIQEIKSTRTYLQSCTFENVMGLASTNATCDDDGNSAGVEYIDEKEKSNIIDMLSDIGRDESDFIKHLKVVSLDMIPKNRYKSSIKILQTAKESMDAKESGGQNDNS